MHVLKRTSILARKARYNATPARRAARRAYAATPRGIQVHRRARRLWRAWRGLVKTKGVTP
jgi:hypothetical protein